MSSDHVRKYNSQKLIASSSLANPGYLFRSMFDELSEKLEATFARLRGRGVLTEADIKEGLREVRRVLLEADVNFQLTREFLERVEKKAVGVAQLRTVSPGQQLVKIVYDELTAMLGERREGLKLSSVPPTVVMMVGLQGRVRRRPPPSSRASSRPRIGRRGSSPRDVYRPAAIDQLETLGAQLDVPVYAERDTKDVVRIAKAGIEQAKRARDRVVIIDTAGRLQIDDDMMQELERLKDGDPSRRDPARRRRHDRTGRGEDRAGLRPAAARHRRHPHEDGRRRTRWRGAVDLRCHEEADQVHRRRRKVRRARGVLSRAHGRAAFSSRATSSSLVEKAQGAFDADEAKRLEKKVRKEGMDLTDFLAAMKQIERLGPLEGLLKMLPGVNTKMLKQVKAADPKRMKHVEAIVLSMTIEERKKPEIMNGSRRARIAKGAGRPISEVNRLLEQFREMQKMMKKAAGSAPGGGGKFKPNMFGMR